MAEPGDESRATEAERLAAANRELRARLTDAEHANRQLAAQAKHLVTLLSEARRQVRATWSEEDRARAEGRL
jgi:hypothetical protein